VEFDTTRPQNAVESTHGLDPSDDYDKSSLFGQSMEIPDITHIESQRDGSR
jgi:hypothetical protein